MGFIRFLLALCVISSHSSSILGTNLMPGDHAVQLFFIISGFYMSLILDKKYSQSPVITFISNRILRLLPTYLVIFAAHWVLFFAIWLYLGKMPATSWLEPWNHSPLIVKLLTCFSNISLFGIDLLSLFYVDPNSNSIAILSSVVTGKTASGLIWAGNLRPIGQIWSIGVELWFYLLAPFLFKLNNKKLLTIIVFSLCLKFWLWNIGSHSHYFFFLAQLCFFCLGMLIYKQSQKMILTQKITLILCTLFSFLIIIFPFITNQMASNISLGLIYVTFIVLLNSLFSVSRHSKIDRFIGNLSYPMYISHTLLIMLQQLVLKTNNGSLAAITTIVISVLIVIFIETPIDKFRQSRITIAP